MARLLLGGHKDHQAAVIDTLHAAGAVHIEDVPDPTHLTQIGTPLPEGNERSAQLVALRGLQKALGVDPEAKPEGAVTDIAGILRTAQDAVQPVAQEAARIRGDLTAATNEAHALEIYRGLDVDLGPLATIQSVALRVGTIRDDVQPALHASGLQVEVSVARGGAAFVIAVVAPLKDAAQLDKILADGGYAAASLPPGAGTPAARIEALTQRTAALEQELASAETKLAQLRTFWASKLRALELELVGEVEKTQAPLKFRVTESTFHVEGWVLRRQLARVEKSLTAAFGDMLYLHDLGDAPAVAGQVHDDASGHHDEAHDAGEHHDDPATEPPVALENPKPARPYQFLLGLLGTPRYKEIDPTKLMLIFFPLFFGLMVGDLLVGIIIAFVGWFLVKNKVFGIGGPAIGKALIAGGIVSAAVGLVVFGEALGIHFVVDDQAAAEGELSWEQIFGAHIPNEGFLHKTGTADGQVHAAVTQVEFVTDPPPVSLLQESAAEEPAGGLGAMLKPKGGTHLSVNGMFNLGYYSKVNDTLALLVWSMIIGVVHVILGLLIGFRNTAVAHGLKLAVQEKAAWLLLMAGGAVAYVGFSLGMSAVLWAGVAACAASVVLLYLGAQAVLGVGFIAFLEIPGLAGNILSYTRLAAIGASKAGMAIAFGTIAFDQIGGGNLHSPVAWTVYLLSFTLIIVLAIIAGTLQSLRLQFVEFFGKFFTGGGRPYVPFGRRRETGPFPS